MSRCKPGRLWEWCKVIYGSGASYRRMNVSSKGLVMSADSNCVTGCAIVLDDDSRMVGEQGMRKQHYTRLESVNCRTNGKVFALHGS